MHLRSFLAAEALRWLGQTPRRPNLQKCLRRRLGAQVSRMRLGQRHQPPVPLHQIASEEASNARLHRNHNHGRRRRNLQHGQQINLRRTQTSSTFSARIWRLPRSLLHTRAASRRAPALRHPLQLLPMIRGKRLVRRLPHPQRLQRRCGGTRLLRLAFKACRSQALLHR